MKTTFTVQPQRSDGVCYLPCEPHRATSWAIVRTDKFTKNSRPYTTSRVVSRCSTKNQAESLALANTKSFAPTPLHLIRKLGHRIFSKGT